MLHLYGLPMYWKQHRNTSVQIIRKKNKLITANVMYVVDHTAAERVVSLALKIRDLRIVFFCVRIESRIESEVYTTQAVHR